MDFGQIIVGGILEGINTNLQNKIVRKQKERLMQDKLNWMLKEERAKSRLEEELRMENLPTRLAYEETTGRAKEKLKRQFTEEQYERELTSLYGPKEKRTPQQVTGYYQKKFGLTPGINQEMLNKLAENDEKGAIQAAKTPAEFTQLINFFNSRTAKPKYIREPNTGTIIGMPTRQGEEPKIYPIPDWTRTVETPEEKTKRMLGQKKAEIVLEEMPTISLEYMGAKDAGDIEGMIESAKTNTERKDVLKAIDAISKQVSSEEKLWLDEQKGRMKQKIKEEGAPARIAERMVSAEAIQPVKGKAKEIDKLKHLKNIEQNYWKNLNDIIKSRGMEPFTIPPLGTPIMPGIRGKIESVSNQELKDSATQLYKQILSVRKKQIEYSKKKIGLEEEPLSKPPRKRLTVQDLLK